MDRLKFAELFFSRNEILRNAEKFGVIKLTIIIFLFFPSSSSSVNNYKLPINRFLVDRFLSIDRDKES